MPLGDGSGLYLKTTQNLDFQRCPHCSTAHPMFARQAIFQTSPKKHAYAAALPQFHVFQWHVYVCESCGGLAGAASVIHSNTAS
ncbi:MAG: hypothetical protein JWM63_3626, partial [Gammaproteobacteria bacterium]|nr:hypothetical protein [Gammaproteobacteria bacterium]